MATLNTHFFSFCILFILFNRTKGSEEGCGEGDHGISCCSKAFTRGDNVGDGGEMFIQSSEYLENCQKSCKNKYPTKSTGVTESLLEKYTTGDGINKNKCWCEFGVAKFGPNSNYQTCMFNKPDAQALVKINPGDIVGDLGYGRTFSIDSVSETGKTMMFHERDLKQCCSDCKKKYPDTQMMNWHMNYIVQDEPVHLCQCLKPLGAQPAITREAGFVAGFCGKDSVDVSGKVLEMRRVDDDTVAHGEVFKVDAEDEDDCCEKCNVGGSYDVDMFEFAKHHKECDCFKKIPGLQPATYQAAQFSAHVCA